MGIIAVLIYGQIDNTAVNSGGAFASTTSAASYARSNFSSNTYGAFQTVSVGPTILAAVAVLSLVGLLLYMGKR
jgi:hypothetical protein